MKIGIIVPTRNPTCGSRGAMNELLFFALACLGLSIVLLIGWWFER